MATASTERHLMTRGWKKLTPLQAKRFVQDGDKIAWRVLRSLMYEVRVLNGSTYLRKL